MSLIQAIPFDASKGGDTPNLCLGNVVKGYQIANKYGSAWQAWEHTQQHPDRNIPPNLDIPLYYAYTTTLDGITQNYGHINVRLKNGTVWSDGKIYTSIEAYTSTHMPIFVGWGESVNDYKIIEEGEAMPDEGTIENIVFKLTGNHATQQQKDVYTKKSINAADGIWYGYEQIEIDRLNQKIADLEAQANTEYVETKVFIPVKKG